MSFGVTEEGVERSADAVFDSGVDGFVEFHVWGHEIPKYELAHRLDGAKLGFAQYRREEATCASPNFDFAGVAVYDFARQARALRTTLTEV